MKKEFRNMSDKELDDFFKATVGKPDIPYQPTDWNKMKTLLDKHSAASGSGMLKFNGRLSMLLVLTVFTAVTWIGWDYFEKSSKDPINLSSDLEEREIEELNFGQIMERERNQNEQIQARELSGDSQSVDFENSKPIDETSVSKTRFEDLPPDPGSIQEFQPADDVVLYPQLRGEIPLLDGLNSRLVALKKHYAENLINSKYTLAKGYNEGEGQHFIERQSLKTINNPPIPEWKDRREFDRFSITFLLSPDVSAIKVKDIQGLGTSVGMNFEYYLYPKLSLNTGVLYAFKTYQGNEGFKYGSGPSIKGLNANCWILDIPINLRYYAINGDKNRWYLGGGISTYLMLKEEYELDYEDYGGQTYPDWLEVRGKNQHYFGIVNLSMGYERRLTGKWSIQIEPYLKLPVNGIGEGAVRLKSTGAFIGLKYSW